MRTLIYYLSACCFISLPIFAGASPAPTVRPAPDANEKKVTRDFEVGVALSGFAIGNFMDEPPNGNSIQRGALTISDIPYGGFAGVGGGGGLTVTGMWRGIIGLELMVFGSSESAKGTLTDRFSGAKTTLTIDQTSWHIPLVLKVAAPTSIVRPQAFVGFDFVFPGEPKMTVSPTPLGVVQLSAKGDSYTALRFGFGLEFMLPVKGIDLRIPFNLAGNYNYSLSDDLEPDRLQLSCSGGALNGSSLNLGQCASTYNTQWKWQAQVSLGLAYYFL